MTIFIPEGGWDDVSTVECPNCGSDIRPPMGGHIWTCHETYGGCGKAYRPIKVFSEVGPELATDTCINDDHTTDDELREFIGKLLDEQDRMEPPVDDEMHGASKAFDTTIDMIKEEFDL